MFVFDERRQRWLVVTLQEQEKEEHLKEVAVLTVTETARENGEELLRQVSGPWATTTVRGERRMPIGDVAAMSTAEATTMSGERQPRPIVIGADTITNWGRPPKLTVTGVLMEVIRSLVREYSPNTQAPLRGFFSPTLCIR